MVSVIPNESPFLAFQWMLGATALAFAEGDLVAPLGVVALALAAFAVVVGVELVRRSLRAGPAIDGALDGALPGGWTRTRRLPWLRILLAPLPVLALDLRRTSNVRYGDGRRNRLDVYRHRSRTPAGPVMIHLHGGRFVTGRKSFEARPLMHRLARRGWVCISANYRLRPAARWPDFLLDAKKVIAWARQHAPALGADPDRIFISGSSAGAHLAVTAALTSNDPRFQAGFEGTDTTVAAAIGLYGYYGPVDSASELPSAPSDFAGPDAPPILIAHGELDTYVSPEHAHCFVDVLRRAGAQPVVYVEVPGAQHSFDLLHSVRFETLIDGIEAFAASATSSN